MIGITIIITDILKIKLLEKLVGILEVILRKLVDDLVAMKQPHLRIVSLGSFLWHIESLKPADTPLAGISDLSRVLSP
ncbi:hypothetical protein KY284_037275 [Solanum tuberosum]|nr:hypothetical protein KY284_037275 [Solanum tuberosum]